MSYPYDIEIKIGQILGRSASCIGKRRYGSRSEAMLAAAGHNRRGGRFHEVESYVCSFCNGGYHNGRKWNIEDIKTLFNKNLGEDEKDALIPLLQNIYDEKSPLQYNYTGVE